MSDSVQSAMMAHKQRRDIAGMLVVTRGAAGVFDERMKPLEHRVSRLEAEWRT